MTRTPLSTILIVALLILAGCTGSPQTGGSADDPTTTAPPTTEPSANASESTVNSTTVTPQPPDAKPYPEQPTNVTSEKARTYVTSYERAYLWNDLLTPNTTNINIGMEDVAVTRADDGFVVSLQVTYYEEIARTGLQHGLHANGNYTVAYFINDTTTIRARTGGQYNVNPIQWGGTQLDNLNRPETAPKRLPSQPTKLTNSSVLAFVSEYEKNYVWTQKLEKYDDLRYVDVAIERESLVNRTGNGYTVHLLVTSGWATGAGESSGEADAAYTVNYFVNESVVMRARGPVGERGPNPQTNGTVVES